MFDQVLKKYCVVASVAILSEGSRRVALATDEVSVGFGEHRVRVDIATAGERVARWSYAGCANAFSASLSATNDRYRTSLVSGSAAISFCAAALGAVAILGSRAAKNSLLLQFDPFPWRVAQDHGESTGPAGHLIDRTRIGSGSGEDMRKLQVPVEESVLGSQPRELEVLFAVQPGGAIA